MTHYLGGPESDDELRARHERYLRSPESGDAWMYAIEVDGVPAGGIGFWRVEHDGEDAYETGWNVLPAWQGGHNPADPCMGAPDPPTVSAT
jgi:RimJ/RimL family protein N-acetyltransferase